MSIARTGAAIAIAIGAGFPLGFAALESASHRHHTAEHAQQIAERIAIYADAGNANWPFNKHTLRLLTSGRGAVPEGYQVEISGVDGRAILQIGETRWLHSIARAPILIRGDRVGTMQVRATLTPSLLRMSAVTLVSAIFGCFALVFFRGVPLRILEQTTAALGVRENELSRQRDELKKQYRITEAALEHMPTGLSMFDSQDRLIACNPTFLRLYNLPANEIRPGTHFRQIIEFGKLAGNHPGHSVEEVFETRRKQILARKAVSTVHHLHGNRIVAVSHVPMKDDGWLATHEDITERCENDARMAHLAGHDPLTDLPNRLTFREALVRSLHTLTTGARVAIHCVDLDHFKEVNDTLGHPIGDGLLKSCVERLRAALGPDVFLARLGGDEFAIIQPDVNGDATGRLAELVLDTLAVPFAVEGHDLLVGASIGVALAPQDGDDPDELLKKADLAMYRAKADGRGSWRAFEPGMDAGLKARRSLEQDLRAALGLQQLELYFQPIFCLKRAQVSGFEALLRWHHPTRGIISPAEFIPVAEETGLIIPIGEWVLRQACSVASAWPDEIKVAVNLSPVQFRSHSLVQGIVNALGEAGLAPSRLELEITESVLLHDSEATLAALHRLRAIGVQVALDDFGTGYSSLSYLRSFPFSKIKIDRSFIRGLNRDDESAAIVRCIVDLGRNLGMDTTAEGVETLTQLEIVHALGCTAIQGYLISPPKPERHCVETIHKFRPSERRAKAA